MSGVLGFVDCPRPSDLVQRLIGLRAYCLGLWSLGILVQGLGLIRCLGVPGRLFHRVAVWGTAWFGV